MQYSRVKVEVERFIDLKLGGDVWVHPLKSVKVLFLKLHNLFTFSKHKQTKLK